MTLGPRWVSLAIGWVAVTYVGMITAETLNYTPVALGRLSLMCVVSWVLYARRWFRGPLGNLDAPTPPDPYDENFRL